MLGQIEILRWEQYAKERLANPAKQITDPMNKNSLPHFSWPPVREKTKTTPRTVIAPSFLGNILHHKWVLRIYEWNFQHENQAYPLETENGYKDRSGRMLGHFPKMFMHLKCSFPTDTACKPSGCLLHWLVPSRQFESWSKRKERNRSVTTCRACYCRNQVGIAAPEQPSSGVFSVYLLSLNQL